MRGFLLAAQSGVCEKLKTIRNLWILPVLVAAGMLLTLHSASAQGSSNLTMQAYANFNGNFKYGEWLPITVTIENNGADLETVVQTTINQSSGNVSFAKRVSLPTGSRKQITLYILPNNFSREIDVRLLSEDELVASQMVEVSPNQNDAFIIGIAAPDWGPLTQISGIKFENMSRKIVLAEVQINQIPELSVALNSFDAIILNDVDTSNLSEDQQLALSAWVKDGGLLILGGGTGLEKTVAGLPENLVPFSISGIESYSELPSLEQFANNEPILLDGPFISAAISSTNVEFKANDSIAQWRLGEGAINLISLSLTDSPFNAWSGTTSFWQNLLEPHANFPLWMPRDMSLRQMRANNMYYPLSNLPALDLPSVKSLGILLIVYILAIGPANYLVLKRAKRLQLAWITIPVLTGIFAAGAFVLAYTLRGNDIVTNKLSIISLNSDGYANINSYIGVFSPAQESYEIEVSGDILLSPTTTNYYDAWSSSVAPTIGETIFMQENPAKVIGLEIGQWSMQTFNSENTAAYFGQLNSDLQINGSIISGEIRNQTDISIKEAVIVVGSSVIPVGDINPGEAKQIKSTIPEQINDFMGGTITYSIMDALYPSGTFDYQRDYELKRSILDTTFQPFGYWIGPDFSSASTQTKDSAYLSNLYLVGWVESSPPEVIINGKEATQNTLGLLTTHLPIKINSGDYTIPSSLIEGSLIKQPLNGGYCGSSATNIYLDFGTAEFEFQLPAAFLNTNIERLLIRFQEDISQWSNVDPGITISAYDWEQGQWSAISDISNGMNAIENAAPFISSEGAVRIQVDKEAQQNVGGCILVSLGLEGVKP